MAEFMMDLSAMTSKLKRTPPRGDAGKLLRRKAADVLNAQLRNNDSVPAKFLHALASTAIEEDDYRQIERALPDEHLPDWRNVTLGELADLDLTRAIVLTHRNKQKDAIKYLNYAHETAARLRDSELLAESERYLWRLASEGV
jgi:hypothetical protein